MDPSFRIEVVAGEVYMSEVGVLGERGLFLFTSSGTELNESIVSRCIHCIRNKIEISTRINKNAIQIFVLE